MRRGLWYSLALCLLILLIGGVGFWALEPGINTLQDGLWLAFTTAATVGYGDTVPQTHMGRVFAVVVVLLGLAVLSLVTASLAALFVEREVEADERQIEVDRDSIDMGHQSLGQARAGATDEGAWHGQDATRAARRRIRP